MTALDPMGLGRYVYLATQWTNPHAAAIKHRLKASGHSYYHFIESGHELDYDSIQPGLRGRPASVQAAALRHSAVAKAAAVNTEALERADVFVLAEPADKGSFAEFGMAVAMGKPTALLVTPEYQIGVMDAAFSYVAQDEDQLVSYLAALPKPAASALDRLREERDEALREVAAAKAFGGGFYGELVTEGTRDWYRAKAALSAIDTKGGGDAEQ